MEEKLNVKQVEAFQTSDGKIFLSEDEATSHEHTIGLTEFLDTEWDFPHIHTEGVAIAIEWCKDNKRKIEKMWKLVELL